MAEIFDKMLVGINKGVNSFSEGSKLVMEKAKLNTQILDIERKRNDLIMKLGEKTFYLQMSKEISVEALENLCREIYDLNNDIKKTVDYLEKLNNEKNIEDSSTKSIKCSCGHTNDKGAKFCVVCGALLEQKVDNKYENGLKCSSCGFMNSSESKYCAECGALLEDKKITQRDEKPPEINNELKCSICGSINSEKSQYCAECGAPLKEKNEEIEESEKIKNELKCSLCGFINLTEAKYCGECGAPLDEKKELKKNESTEEINRELKCSSCGYINHANSRFCAECGKSLINNKNTDTTSKGNLYSENKCKCGYVNKPGVWFCEKCGNILKKN